MTAATTLPVTVRPIRSWRELVDAGRLAAGRLGNAKWELGDLALEAAPLQAPGGSTTGAYERLREFADEIDLAFDTLRGYRNVAANWTADDRAPSLSWTAHRELLKAEDPAKAMVEILTLDPPSGDRWTVAAISAHIGATVWGSARRSSPAGRTEPKDLPPSLDPSDADSAAERLRVEATNLRNWIASAELEETDRADLAEQLDEALDVLREARKRLGSW